VKTEDYQYKIAVYVTQLLKEQKKTQLQLCFESGVSPKTIYALINGKRFISIENMFKLAKAFKIHPLDFLALGYPVIKPFE